MTYFSLSVTGQNLCYHYLSCIIIDLRRNFTTQSFFLKPSSRTQCTRGSCVPIVYTNENITQKFLNDGVKARTYLAAWK